MQVLDGRGYVLSVRAIENPDFPICNGPRDSVAVVVEQDSFLFGVTP
jgi:hypothetical protein